MKRKGTLSTLLNWVIATLLLVAGGAGLVQGRTVAGTLAILVSLVLFVPLVYPLFRRKN